MYVKILNNSNISKRKVKLIFKKFDILIFQMLIHYQLFISLPLAPRPYEGQFEEHL